jgi:hypothetical protein
MNNPKFRKLIRRVKRAVPQSLMASIDWSRYSVDDWLEQYGNWVNDRNDMGSSSGSPMFSAVASHKRKVGRSSNDACNITDDEARAVMRIILDMRTTTDEGKAKAQAVCNVFESRMSMRAAADHQGIPTISLRLYLAEAKGYIAGRMGMGEQRYDTVRVAA